MESFRKDSVSRNQLYITPEKDQLKKRHLKYDLEKLSLDEKNLKLRILRLASLFHNLYAMEELNTKSVDKLKRVDFKLDGLNKVELLQIYSRLNAEYSNAKARIEKKKAKPPLEPHKIAHSLNKTGLKIVKILPPDSFKTRNKNSSRCRPDSMLKFSTSLDAKGFMRERNRGIASKFSIRNNEYLKAAILQYIRPDKSALPEISRKFKYTPPKPKPKPKPHEKSKEATIKLTAEDGYNEWKSDDEEGILDKFIEAKYG